MKPNILFILIDDMGWRDLACFGSTFYETPNLDKLAQESLLFSDAYAACPVCSPTRASLLSGKYPAAVGVTNYIDWSRNHHPSQGKLIDAPYVHQLPQEEFSLARALKAGGYATWHVGKWHLGGEGYYPHQHGFDVNVGGCEWGMPAKGYFSPWHIPGKENGEDGEYLTNHLTDKAVDLIENNDPEQPFFLNLWYYSVHTPNQAPEADIERFREKAKKMKLDQVNPFVEGDYFPCEHKKTKRVQRRVIQSDPVYAAMIYRLDANIGRVLKAIEDKGQADNTIVIFTSDNGGLSTAEGAPTCNFPAIEGKGWMYEGGTREPLIIKYPGVTPASTWTDVPVSSPDFYPTLLEAAGLPLRPEQHRDGVSLMPVLHGDTLPERPLFWHYPHYGNQGGTPGSSVRLGDYKLIEFFEDGHLELYNLREDISEQHNLADEMPELAAEMQTMLIAWRGSIEAAMPEENPDFEPWREGDVSAPYV